MNPNITDGSPIGITYQMTDRTVLHGAFAMLDDHNNSLVQANQGIRLSWPTAVSANFTSLDLGIAQLISTASFLGVDP